MEGFTEHKTSVQEFLRRLSTASYRLSIFNNKINKNNHDTVMVDEESNRMDQEDATDHLDLIARHLLTACDIRVLSSGTLNLPPFNYSKEKLWDDTEKDDDDDNHDDAKIPKPYQHKRSDYLRKLLRVMAPVSMQIAANICSLSSSKEERKQSQAAVVLFSHWLPVAPHLTPMVTEYFRSCDDPWKQSIAEGQDSIKDLSCQAEACYNLTLFYSKRGDIYSIRNLWDWKFLFVMLQPRDIAMGDDENDSSTDGTGEDEKAIRWFAARILGRLLDWKPDVILSTLQRLGLEDNRVPWLVHPWEVNQEEADMQNSVFRSRVSLWGSDEFDLPSAEQVQQVLPSNNFLANLGPGLIFYKYSSLTKASSKIGETSGAQKHLILTPTTCRNLALLGSVLCEEPNPPPILICGPHGSGKSSLIRELLRLCRPEEDSLLEFHIDEETDSKTLIGSYTTTDIPGEFAWRAGALTHATREGQWVLIEDVDSVPVEIQATLTKLLEDRMLPLGNGKYERCHPNFRIFGTCTTTPHYEQQRQSLRVSAHRGGGKRILCPSLWRNVHVKPLPFSELKQVASSLFTNLPESVIDTSLSLLQTLDRSGRDEVVPTQASSSGDGMNDEFSGSNILDVRDVRLWTGGRNPSVRDFFKLLSRISNGVCFESNVAFTTEAQRTLCLAECVDIFVGSCPNRQLKTEFVNFVAAPIWSISRDLAISYVETRRPPTLVGADVVEIGRAKIHLGNHIELSQRSTSQTFAQTNHALRLMEALGICIRENEPALLVGETGCGKTTLVQQLAVNCERELIVQNLSLQTDSTDLLGGYKPLEIQNVARKVYNEFVDLFVATFSRKQNAKFLQYAASMLEKANWKKLSRCFQRASQLGQSKMKEKVKDTALVSSKKRITLSRSWNKFSETTERFERQRVSCDAGLAFVFSEGVLVDAIHSGKWVLLDEINLASSDTLQRLCGLLDDPTGSVTLTERGDASAIVRHPSFRLFAAMNPATDAGKKDLPASIRSRFSELYVDELLDPVELRVVASRYLDGVLPTNGKPPEHLEIVVNAVDVYLKCRHLADTILSDGGGHKPRYTMRTLSRALSAAKNLVVQQRIPLERAVYEGFQLSFEGALDAASVIAVRKALKPLLSASMKKSGLEHPGRKPGGKNEKDAFVLLKPFWVKAGPEEITDWSEVSTTTGKARFILTPSVALSLRRLSRALAAGPWPVLLEGPTSAGKTTLVEYIASRCGHKVIRINNHEHTDVQEYTGSFVADQSGSLSFRDGLLVRALRRGHWVILDELNLAPSEVLEALNRLLDDNRELYLAETNETVKPHPSFRLFATQNPCGVYGGRKPLSRAFRNRFVEIHMSDIPSTEMITILEKRCACPPSHAKRLVEIMVTLRNRRSKSNVFLGKDSFITPRDLLRWAERQSTSKLELAEQGFMLLAERLRSDDEKKLVQEVLEEHLKVQLNMQAKYYGDNSEARKLLKQATEEAHLSADPLMDSIAATQTLLRLISLVLRCIKQKEPVLLVGDTGCGKTTVVQFLSFVFNKTLYAVNCHATTETSDLIGGLRPVRGRDLLLKQILMKIKYLIKQWPHQECLRDLKIPKYLPSIFQKLSILSVDGSDGNFEIENGLEVCDVKELVSLARSVLKCRPTNEDKEGRMKKRRKLTSSVSSDISEGESDDEGSGIFKSLVTEIEDLGRRHASLFEWSDGPLVHAMKSGQMLLLDEMSLAEDAVLERLNSVLEPSRTLVLAEKGDDGSGTENRIVVADDGFRIFATMNPGGDFGKRELSPALRSRFTEIWVPAVTARADFELVLGRTLVPRNIQISSSKEARVVEAMLTYVEWFNGTICGGKTSPYADFKLTLRDVLSWARFVVEAQKANRDLALWDAYCHGACLMHLDGFGLGAGLAVEDAANVKRRAESFLLSQLPPVTSVSNLGGTKEKFGIRELIGFGAFPFFTHVGPHPVPESRFNLTAPTTALNMFRVLRAMQLSKPVLLEGSPGVGKTSLITALAAASGHKLVRINLSEQTDIADLMGSDLPVQSNTGGASFEWCDGILLTAIKEGSWVLLDELNLASQTVLEGLNSCLDHRASVYIPELGKTYRCPYTFRVFAAQNPLGQGGGRKGLPKSFLNRFTKVFVDPLKDSDLRSIVSSKHPSFGKDLIDKMINFNNAIHSDIVENREYGSEGSPWEFNLRDVFRWCELIMTKSATNEDYARDLYLQRFRTSGDRERIDQVYRKHFGPSLKSIEPPELELRESHLRVGDTILKRNVSSQNEERENSLWSEPRVYLSQLLPMEAVARCVLLRWPCLLVGQAASGKTSIVSTLAELCNVKLVEQCLSPSSDVTELVGCFEQIENMWKEREVLNELLELANEFIRFDGFQSLICTKVWELIDALAQCLDTLPNSFASFAKKEDGSLSQAEELSRILLDGQRNCHGFHQMYSKRVELIAETLEQWSKDEHTQSDITGHFVWRDGILVEAMTKGFWLVLENVNLCPSSVLDRLNSVMEKDGFLLLSECGTSDGGEGSSSHRLIRPHPNFRVFLTMNATNGEISRAMRNRCVEISLVQSIKINQLQDDTHKRLDVTCSVSKEEKIDFLEMLNHAGARSLQLSSALQLAYSSEYAKSIYSGEEPPCLRDVSGGMSMLSGLLSRGISGGNAIHNFLQISFELEKDKVSEHITEHHFEDFTLAKYTSLPQVSSVRDSWILNGPFAHVQWDARLLRLLMESKSNLRAALLDSKLGLLNFDEVDPQLASRYKVLDPSKYFDEVHLRGMLIEFFLSKMSAEDAEARSSCLAGLDNSCSMALGWMGSTFKASELSKIESQELHDMKPFLSHVRILQLRHLAQQLREEIWFRSVSLIKTPVESLETLKVLDASFFIYETLLDRSTFSCPVTPFFYPFFLAMDSMIDQFNYDCSRLESDEEATLVAYLSKILDERDRLWCTLESCPITLKADAFLAFEETEFIVQWKWLKKGILRLSYSCEMFFSAQSKSLKQKVDSLILAIDGVIFGSESSEWSPHKMQKKMIRPAVPHRSHHFEKILQTRALAEECTILTDQRFIPFESTSGPIELKELTDIYHPVLFVSGEEKVQMLAALCTMYWSWTNEIGAGEKLESSLFTGVDFHKKSNETFEKKREDFTAEFAKAKVDKQIATVENQFDVEMLESLKSEAAEAISSNEAFARLTKMLLFAFGKVQLSVLAEFWCINEEMRLSGEICKLLLEFRDERLIGKKLQLLLPSFKRLVRVSLHQTIWSLIDLRPHQTLIWAIEGGVEKCTSFRHLLRYLLPSFLCTLSKHMWRNSFANLNSISMSLELPNMWIDDEVQTYRFSRLYDKEEYYGSARMNHRIRSEFSMLLFGKQLAWTKTRESGKFHTMENHMFRLEQYRSMNKMLSSFSICESKTKLFTAHYLLTDILEALDVMEQGPIARLLPLAKQPVLLQGADLSEVKNDEEDSGSGFCKIYLDDLVLPLLESMQQAWNLQIGSKEYEEEVALVSVYLGLLRLNLLTPDSPLDPGRAPLAKISLIDRKLTAMGTKLTASRLDSGFTCGNFTPSCRDTLLLLEEGDRMVTKRSSHQKKIVERITSAPAFHELYREVKDFVGTVSGKATVLELVENLRSRRENSVELEITMQRAANWLRTANAFCRRLNDQYDAYEDVIATLVDSMQMIQDGLLVMIEANASRCASEYVELFNLLLVFPMQDHSVAIKSLVASLSSMTSDNATLLSQQKSDYLFSLSLAALTRLLLKKRLVGLNNEEISWCCRVFECLANSHLTGKTEKLVQDETLEAIQEREFREQFPNHRKDFHNLLKESDENFEDEESEQMEADESFEETAIMTELQIELLYSMHRELFSQETSVLTDSTRTLAFHSSYSAAYELEKLFGCSRHASLKAESIGSHVFAMALTALPKKGTLRVHSHLNGKSGLIDFQNEPCPAEAMSAAEPLESLMARATQLLTAFPGHSILLGLGKICEKVRKLDLMSTPIGKIMTGLEVILRHAQDWEQHASDRVRLGKALQDIGQLVAKWRKLELESWSQLVRARQDRQVANAKKFIIRLHGVLHSENMDNRLEKPDEGFGSVDPFTQSDPSTPNWIWKGFSSTKQKLSGSFEYGNTEEMTNLVKALDTFILTSPLGEFEERLNLLKSYSIQLLTEYNISSMTSNWKLQQSRAISSIWSYYNQFLPMLSSKLESLKAPIELKLKDEVKLAKWDEQSYYALAESSDRNYRKLMKVLSEMDECLRLNVGLLIQEDTYRGIRSNPDANDEFCASVPSHALMFPIITSNSKRIASKKHEPSEFLRHTKKEAWVNASDMGASADSHICKIEKYAFKMCSMTKTGEAFSKLWGNEGSDAASSFCDAIFERIGALRTKSTRPMKERALVDLFRELKRNGFACTKWALPKELRHMEHIFQLPSPKLRGTKLQGVESSKLEGAEKYFARCLTELNAFRSESLMLGSKYMTTREMNLMLCLSESVMLMLCQQRCLVANAIADNALLVKYTAAMYFENRSLPTSQQRLQGLTRAFERGYISSIESLKELSLIIKSSQNLFDTTEKGDWARDAITKLESFLLPTPMKKKQEMSMFVTWKRLEELEKETIELREAQSVVQECRGGCKDLVCLPLDIFDASLSVISSTLDFSTQCKESLSIENSDTMESGTSHLFSSLSFAVERLLITFQNLWNDPKTSDVLSESDSNNNNSQDEDDASILDCHKRLMKKWAGINLKELNRYLGDMLDHLYEIHKGDDIGEKQRKAFVGLTSNVGFLSRHVQALSESYLQDSFKFYFDASKFLYVLLRVFRVLVSKGYCSDDTSEDDDGEADGDINGMTFEDDQDGTGMGEGDGKKDVTDQLESEEQLAGLKDDQDKNEENPENRESKQLDEEEAEQGMEMEGDFNGEMFDLPDKEPDDDMEEQEGEELDREMGSGSPDEQVVDEKMWNESDDDDDINKEEEKFEKDSGVEGEAVEGEIRTMEHDEGDDPKGDDEKKESKPDLQKPQGDDDAGDMGDMDFEEEEDHINDENDDNVEEQHGVDVRGNEQEQQEDTNDENELQLDDDVCLDGEENENGEDNDVEKNVEAGEDIEDSESVGSEVNEDQAEADSPEDEDCDVDPSDAVTSNGQGAVEKDDDPKDESDPQEDPMEDNAIESMNQDPSTEEAHGVKSKQGTDAVMEDEVDDKNEEKEEQGEDEKGGTNGASQAENSQADDLGQGGGYSERDGALDNPTETSGEQDADEIPNPFKDPGDASKFWHKKLNMVDSNPENDSEGGQEENITEEEEQGKGGDFEYAPRDENNSSQVLGEATEEEATKLDNMQKEENDEDEEIENHQNEKDKSVEQAKQRSQRKDKKASQQSKKIESLEQENEDNTSDDEISRMDEDFKEDEAEDREDESSDDGISGNLVTSDLSKLTVGDDDGEFSPQSQLIQDEQISGISSAEAAEARLKWLQIQGETHNLSRRLCEKLRLVMEPLVASKLRGDYRTGKRINMKRVIGYIASGYRKDKIWLRRTKPAKRDYRVLLAIDDSESMKKSGAGEMALHAMATMAVGMNQLEIGELGIASFGDDMKLLHPYHLPFTSESGSDMVVNFGFDQKRTRTALCVESALVSLEQYGDSSSMQLVFLISDGRIERDSRSALRRLIREMAERNILLAMIIVEGKNKKKDSIVNMKEVTFEKGKPVVKRFIDDYPFPYYIILDDMTSLPEVLGGALRQWFEMLAQLNSAK